MEQVVDELDIEDYSVSQTSLDNVSRVYIIGPQNLVCVKVFKNGPSKICGRQPFKNIRWHGLLKQTISLQTFLRQSSTNFTWSILEYHDQFFIQISWILRHRKSWLILNYIYFLLFHTEIITLKQFICSYGVPGNIYLFKVNNRNTRKRYEICSKFTLKAPFSSVSILDFERGNISRLDWLNDFCIA